MKNESSSLRFLTSKIFVHSVCILYDNLSDLHVPWFEVLFFLCDWKSQVMLQKLEVELQ